VGYIETEGDTFVFAMNMAMNDMKQAPLHKKLVIQSLQALKLI
jgi:beta-lactamase class D